MIETLRKWWRQRVFKRIQIDLTGPICNCEEQNLSWYIRTVGDRYTIAVGCDICKGELRVGPEKFVACFNLDKEYPKGPARKKEDAKIFKLIPGDKKE